MKQKSGPDKAPAEQVLKNIRRQTRRQYSAEEKIRIVLEGLRGEENISELCRREGIAASMYYGCPLGPTVCKTARPPQRLFRLVFESHDGRALVPIPKRSTSPRATSTLWWWIV